MSMMTEFEDELMEYEDESMDFEDESMDFEEENEDFLGGLVKSGLSSLVNSVLGSEMSGPFSEHEETEFANELLEISDERELDQFLGKLVSSAAKGVSNFAKSSVGKQIGSALKGVAKKALPVVGGAVGNVIAPGVGGLIGGKLGSLAGGLFEMEQELNEQELEFEMARRVVRIGGTAARQGAKLAQSGMQPKAAARKAVLTAVRAHAPAVLRQSGSSRSSMSGGQGQQRFRGRRPSGGRRQQSPRGGGYRSQQIIQQGGHGQREDSDFDNGGFPMGDNGASSGRWVRRGRNIVLVGV